jgi:predicted phage terminase large subunit-like protein
MSNESQKLNPKLFDLTVEQDEERVFLPAKLDDNPHLDQVEYEKSLDNLDPVTRQQLLNGDWSARQGGSKFRREWFEIVDAAPADCQRVRRWDMAATEPKPGKDPDWTAGCLVGLSGTNTLYIIDMKRMRGTPGACEALVKQTAEIDGYEVMIRMEQEPGSSGVKAIDDYQRRVLMGYDFRGIPSTGKKEVRANPLASQAEAGNVKLVRGPWIGAFLDEAEIFPLGGHDDQIDAASGALADLVGAQCGFMVGVAG